MREKLETLSLTQLKELAKGAGMKGVSTMRKAELIERLVLHAEAEEAEKAAAEKAAAEKAAAEKAAAEKAAAEKAAAEKAAAEKAAAEKAAAEKAAAEKAAAEKAAAETSAEEKNTEAKAEETRTSGERTPEKRKSAGTRKAPEDKKSGAEIKRKAPDGKKRTTETGLNPEKTEKTSVKKPVHEATGHRHVQQDQATRDSSKQVKAVHEHVSRGNNSSGRKQAASAIPVPVNGSTDRPANATGKNTAGIPAQASGNTASEKSVSMQERGNGPAERPASGNSAENPGTVNRTEKPDIVNRTEKPGTVNQTEKPGTVNRTEKTVIVNLTEKPGIVNQTEKPGTAAERSGVPAERETLSTDREKKNAELQAMVDQGPMASGILEVMQDGFGFIRCENYLPGDDDVYVSPSQIRRFNLKTGDIVMGNKRMKTAAEKFAALLYVNSVNGVRPAEILKRENFEDMTPIFPNERIRLAVPGTTTAMRIVDLVSPIGKGQRGMIVSPPKAGKTTLLKQIAKVITGNLPNMHLIILLIDERPEEVTDIKEYIEGPQVEVIYSTFDEQPERHKRVSEMVIERAKRLVEQHRDVTILLDSITRLSRAYNLTITPSGRTLSGGLDPAALYMPKRFFGAARNMREGGSLTILATALIDTGSRMDDVVYEEFKGTGNMELVLDRKLSEKRIFPAIDILKSGTRRDDLLLSKEESEVLDMIHKATTSTNRPEDAVERILDMFARTASNEELIRYARYNRRI